MAYWLRFGSSVQADFIRRGNSRTRQEEHLLLLDADILELAIIDDFEEHAALILVEPLGRLVDVVVCPLVGTANYLGIVD